MKISPINQNNRNFKQLYIYNGIGNRRLNKSINKLAQELYCVTDSADNLDRHNIDIYIYPNRKSNNNSAKVVFADKQGAVYRLPNGKYCENTKEVNIESEEKLSMYNISNAANVLACVDKLLFGKEPLEKSADCNEAKEIKEVFSEKNKKFIYPFPVFK